MKPTLILAIFLALIVVAQTSPVSFNEREEGSTTVNVPKDPTGVNPATSERTVPTGASSPGLVILIFYFINNAEPSPEGLNTIIADR
ncbi:hypothetical protein GLOIN_2v1786695 [Rhizophagus clarus]|uniref:Uncharacterized protein n=1 Tax=Rhizophagus clarus TaxID=94130 RepID=A0A8H3R5K7_9GLOM|nr:hypothetical protein GLOIN_2v1786695 [Rhizophagus clarus]